MGVLYLGGSPCSGKSSVAEILKSRYSLKYLRLDDWLEAHIQSASPDTEPTLAFFRTASCDETWLISPREQVRREIQVYAEEFPLHQAEIAKIADPLILVEGAALLPGLIAPILPAKTHALYMIPTPAFQRQHYRQRPWVADVLSACTDPDQAFENWMRRDEIFARWVQRSAQSDGIQVMVVDGSHDIETTAQAVALYFGLS